MALAAHAAEAIALGKCDVALVTLAGRPRSEGQATGTTPRLRDPNQPEAPWEVPYGMTTANGYAMCAMRHMHQYGTTSEQLAWIKVAASHHAQHNPNAMLPEVITVEDVVNSPVIADPLHRLDCCVISDGGGALIIVKPEIAEKTQATAGENHRRRRNREAPLWRHLRSHHVGRGAHRADRFRRGGHHTHRHQICLDLRQLHHHGAHPDRGFRLLFKGAGGKFVSDGNLISGVGKLPFNTDGGGLCNNDHPANRGGMTKVIEAVRQLRGEAHPKVQVKNCDLALRRAPVCSSARAIAAPR